jgi:glycosyltransferase involved in cell wall biosynthesis
MGKQSQYQEQVMINGKKVIVVLPAYNAGQTLESTYAEIPRDIVDGVILVDDASSDGTFDIANKLGISRIIRHEKNRGYGGNQKTCYSTALAMGADIVIMLHPDYQYSPKLLAAMAHIIASGLYHVVFGSRILGKGALRGGMPLYKYIANRLLTFIQNLCMNQKLSEYHTGYRAFSREALQQIPYRSNSDDFVFDNEIIAQLFYAGFDIAEVTCPTRYFEEASSITITRSIIYGLGVLRVTLSYMLQRAGIINHRRFHLRA